MDISKFNSELRIKIGKANGYEKNKMLKEAVNLWIEISEMTLKVSQVPNLDFSYRSMLIKKTEEILNHIKDLKSMMVKPVDFEDNIDVSLTQLDSEKTTSNEKTESPATGPSQINSDPINKADLDKKEVISEPNVEVVSDSEFKNLPIGFKQIKPPEDFQILTPHDKDYVQKRINQDVDMSVIKKPKEAEIPEDDSREQAKIELDKPEDENKIICFACGQEQPSKVKICKNCGTLLDK